MYGKGVLDAVVLLIRGQAHTRHIYRAQAGSREQNNVPLSLIRHYVEVTAITVTICYSGPRNARLERLERLHYYCCAS